MIAKLSGTLLFTLIFFNCFADLGTIAQTPPQNPPQLRSDDDQGSVHTLPVGTVIRVRMDNGISSRSAAVGDTFTTTVSESFRVRNVEVVPVGTILEGRIVEVKPARRGGVVGTITVVFETMRLPGVASRRISGEVMDLSSEIDAMVAGRQQIEGNASRGHKAAYIAGGAGAGAIVGGLARGGGGAAIGGAVGAGAGMLASYLRKGEEAVIGTDKELGVLLRQSVTLPARDY